MVELIAGLRPETSSVVGMPCHLVATGTHDLEQLAQTGATSVHEDLFALARECFDLDLDPTDPEEIIASA